MLLQALRRSKHSTPGPDGVKYEHIKALIKTGIQRVVDDSMKIYKTVKCQSSGYMDTYNRYLNPKKIQHR